MLTWIYAYRAARKGDWERYARDADRFRERIDSMAAVLAPVFDRHSENVSVGETSTTMQAIPTRATDQNERRQVSCRAMHTT